MNRSDLARNANMLMNPFTKKGYYRWWHSFSGVQVDTGEMRTFFVEFFVVNPAMGTDRPILGQHPYYRRREMKPSYVCVKAGVFPDANGENGKQLHAFYPISSLKLTPHPLVIQVEDCFYSEERLTGAIEVAPEEAAHPFFMSDAGSIVWNVEVHKAIACHTGLLGSKMAQIFNVLESYWHGEGIKSLFRGSVILDGIEYEIRSELSYGYADKHWGRNFNSPWLQLASSKLTSERTGKELRHSCIAVNGCCPRFLFLPLRRKLLIQLTYTGEDFEFGMTPFTLSRCKWETKESKKRFVWHIIAKNKDSVIKISASCIKEQMLHLRYENPDGVLSRFPLWAGGDGEGTIQLFRRIPGGREYIDTLHMENLFCEYRRE
jgi:hypothetical protein